MPDHELLWTNWYAKRDLNAFEMRVTREWVPEADDVPGHWTLRFSSDVEGEHYRIDLIPNDARSLGYALEEQTWEPPYGA